MPLKREIVSFRTLTYGCCPGHDLFPIGTYKSRRSKKKRAKDKIKEHKMVRHYVKVLINEELYQLEEAEVESEI